MTLQQIADALDLMVFTEGIGLKSEFEGGYVSDLLSDVMGHAREGEVWITLQAHANVVAIASLKELPAVILVNGIEPDVAVIEKAAEEGIVLLGTSEGTFDTAGKLFQYLN
ncbi:MAG: serine kinase [Bacteroidetes bacterium]|nr:serine kinase [Bacteroidota bacterium]